MEKSKYIVLDSLSPADALDVNFRALFDQVATGARQFSLEKERLRTRDFQKLLEKSAINLRAALMDAKYFSFNRTFELESIATSAGELASAVARMIADPDHMAAQRAPAEFLWRNAQAVHSRGSEALTEAKWIELILSNWKKLDLIASDKASDLTNADFVSRLAQLYESSRVATLRRNVKKSE